MRSQNWTIIKFGESKLYLNLKYINVAKETLKNRALIKIKMWAIKQNTKLSKDKGFHCQIDGIKTPK
jgi:hypothetical protein